MIIRYHFHLTDWKAKIQPFARFLKGRQKIGLYSQHAHEYAIEHSVAGMFKGMTLRMPTLIKAM